MSEYEITYLSSGQLDEEARTQLDGAIDELIEKHQGKITHAQPNVRRRLFYPIKKQQIGFARVLQVELDPAQLQDVQGAITKQAGILRLTVLKTPRRESVTSAIFENLKAPATPATATKAEPKKKSTKPVTMAEVEEKIEEALEEEVK